jgi:hypothetical protein
VGLFFPDNWALALKVWNCLITVVSGFSKRLSVESLIWKDWFPNFSTTAPLIVDTSDRGECCLLSSPYHGWLISRSNFWAGFRFIEIFATFSRFPSMSDSDYPLEIMLSSWLSSELGTIEKVLSCCIPLAFERVVRMFPGSLFACFTGFREALVFAFEGHSLDCT